jgi:hypothetical protein
MRHCGSFLSGFASIVGNRPIYPVVFIDAMVVKIRDGMAASRPVY